VVGAGSSPRSTCTGAQGVATAARVREGAGGRPGVACLSVSISRAGGEPGIAGDLCTSELGRVNWSTRKAGPGMVAVGAALMKLEASEVGMEVLVLVVATGSAWLAEVGVGASGRSARVGTGGRVEVR
jgi:hypothetical protein